MNSTNGSQVAVLIDFELEASCLEFENPPDDAAPSSAPLDKRVKLKSSIDDPRSLLRSIDRFLSEIIQRESIPNEINCEALSKVLYGTAEKPELVNQVRRMVGKPDPAAPGTSSIPITPFATP